MAGAIGHTRHVGSDGKNSGSPSPCPFPHQMGKGWPSGRVRDNRAFCIVGGGIKQCRIWPRRAGALVIEEIPGRKALGGLGAWPSLMQGYDLLLEKRVRRQFERAGLRLRGVIYRLRFGDSWSRGRLCLIIPSHQHTHPDPKGIPLISNRSSNVRPFFCCLHPSSCRLSRLGPPAPSSTARRSSRGRTCLGLMVISIMILP